MEPYTASFLEFLPHFFTSLKYFTWSHLWFLAYLLVMTSLAAPLLARVARARTELASHPLLSLLLPGVVLLVSESILRPHWPNSQTLIGDWANLVRYSIYFGMGIAWARYANLGDKMRTRWPRP